MHTHASLTSDLRAMGIAPEDTVLVHSSMRSIGDVEGGADTVVTALMDHLAPGLLVIPALTWTVADEQSPLFDVRRTAPIVGLLPTLFWQRPGVLRSWHPTHSVCAFGPDAETFTAGGETWHTPCAYESSWRRLYDRDATILMVGCTLTTCTFLHGVEEWAGIPGRIGASRPMTIRTPDGDLLQTTSAPHLGAVSEQYWRIEPDLRAAGALVDGRLGDAPVMVISARKACDIVTDRLAKEPNLFGGEGE